MVILALGQAPDPENVDAVLASAISRVNSDSLMTEVPGVFAGGDFVTGPSTIIEAVAEGRAAAAAIHRYLGETFAAGTTWPGIEDLEVEPIGSELILAPVRLERGLQLDNEVEQTLLEPDAMAEGLRCLFCGLVPVITFDKCTACQECALICPVECIDRVALSEDGSTRAVAGIGDVVVYEIDSDQCIRCGRCFRVCPTGAIVVDGFEWK
jgi:ferredoxin